MPRSRILRPRTLGALAVALALAPVTACAAEDSQPSKLARMRERLLERRAMREGIDQAVAEAKAIPIPEAPPEDAAEPRTNQILFATGERVEGKISSVKKGVVTFAAFLSTAIQAKLESIVDVHQTEELVVILESGTQLRGMLRQDGRPDTWTVRTPVGGDVRVARSRIKRVATPAALEAEHKDLEEKGTVRLSKYWKGYVDAGFASSTGNAETQDGKVQMEVTRTTPVDKFRMNVFTQQASANGTKTVDKTYGEGRFDVYMKNRLFYFVQGRLETDEIRNLDLRTAIGAGLGYKIFDQPGKKMDFGLGYSFVREAFNTGADNSQGTLLATVDVDRDFSDTLSFEWRLSANPDFGSPSDLLLKSVATLKNKISGDLSFTVGHIYNYDKVPPTGAERRDITITTGLRKDF